MKLKAFTVDEANAMILHLEVIDEVLETKKAKARALHPRLATFDVKWGEKLADLGNSDQGEALELGGEGRILEIVEQIQGIGVELAQDAVLVGG